MDIKCKECGSNINLDQSLRDEILNHEIQKHDQVTQTKHQKEIKEMQRVHEESIKSKEVTIEENFKNNQQKGIGLVYFSGPTMGYLIGFIFTVYFVGFFKFHKNFFIKFLQLVFSVSFIYVLGLVWLGVLIGWDKPLFQLGVQPFLLAELFKVLIVLFSLSKLKKLSQFLQ